MPLHHRKMMRFAGLSLLSFVTNAGGTALLHEGLGWPEELAYAIALITVFCQNFLICRCYVFDSRHEPFWRQVRQFLYATAGFRLLEYVAFLVLVNLIGVHYLVAVIINSGVFTLAKYLFLGKQVFPQRDTNDLPRTENPP